MNKKAIKTIEHYDMLSYSSNVIVGLSGGADSVALLHFLYEISEIYGIRVSACHVNHCLRGDESERDQLFVEKMCKDLGVELSVFKFDVMSYAKEHHISVEMAARTLRYSAFEKAACNNTIATAHTLSDNLETVLFSLGRGTGLKGLTGIPPKRDNIIRPLIGCTRSDIENYIQKRNLTYVTDSTNLSDQYTRNHIRINIVPEFKKIFPSIESSIYKLTYILRDDCDYLDNEAKKNFLKIQTDNGYNIDSYLELHPAIRKRILINLMSSYNLEYSSDRLSLLENSILTGTGAVELKKELYFLIKDGKFCIKFKHKLENKHYDIILSKNDLLLECKAHFLDKMIITTLLDKENYILKQNCYKKNTTFFMDYDKIYGNIHIRTRQKGDKICLKEKNCTKSLKKLFNELKIPVEIRNKLIVIADDYGILWIENIGADSRSVIDCNTKTVAMININYLGV